MKRVVSRVWAVRAIRLALTLSLISGGTLLARQDPPAQQPAAAQQDNLKLANSPHLIIWGVKPTKAADFEALWAGLQAQFAKSERPEVKEFGASITSMYKLSAAPQPGQPVIFVFQVEKPSQTQSYNPGRIIYEFLYKLDKDNKELGIPRAEADELFKKIGSNLTDMFDSINTWPLTKIGS